MEQKYYFICYTMSSGTRTYQILNCVSKIHPIKFLLEERKYRGDYWVIKLISWQEISEKEYEDWPE